MHEHEFSRLPLIHAIYMYSYLLRCQLKVYTQWKIIDRDPLHESHVYQ